MNKILTGYQNFLARRPILTQSVQSGLIMATGDVIAQKFVEGKSFRELELSRTRNFLLIGTFFVGPSLTVWYRTLQRIAGSHSKVSVVKKVAMDQLCFAPVFTAAVVFNLGLMSGAPVEEAKKNVTDNYVDIMKMNYCIWPMAQIVNFFIVPLNYQVLFAQVIAVAWNTYLSWKTSGINQKSTVGDIEY